MNKILKRLLGLALALCLLLPGAAAFAEGEEGEGASLSVVFSSCDTVYELFAAAEAALEAGDDPARVRMEMYSVADEKGMMPWFSYAVENAAARDTEARRKIEAVDSEERRSLSSVSTTQPRAQRGKIDFNAYEAYVGSDAFMSMIADPGAQFCVTPFYWSETDFSQVFGVDFSKFRPSRPRAGYVCVVVKKGTQGFPETAWDHTDQTIFYDFMTQSIRDLMEAASLDTEVIPVITGNPELASSFWVFDMGFSFYAKYGSDGAIRGFHTKAGLTVTDADHKTVAEISELVKLPDTIYYHVDGCAWADPPVLCNLASYTAFSDKVVREIMRQDSTVASDRMITSGNAEEVLGALLIEQTVGNKNAWQCAIYESGVKNVYFGENEVTFSLRSYDPQLKALGAYAKAEDKPAWIRAAMENASQYDLELTLPMENGRLTDRAVATLTGTVKKAAAAAQKSFSGKDMASALMDWLFPAPVDGKVTDPSVLVEPSDSFRAFCGLMDAGVSPGLHSLICYAQKSVKLSFNDGPHAITVNCVSGDPASMMESSKYAALDALAYLSSASRPDNLEEMVTAAMVSAVADSHSKGKVKSSFTVDADALLTGATPPEYAKYLQQYDLYGTIEEVRDLASQLPDRAALSYPGNVLLYGGGSGTSFTIKASKDSNPIYAQVRRQDNNQLVATAFILPGKGVKMRVPLANYVVVFASGKYWYGETDLFGDLGTYQKSNPISIDSNRYRYTYTIGIANGNHGSVNASKEDFR